MRFLNAIRANMSYITQNDVEVALNPVVFTNRAILSQVTPPLFNQQEEISTFTLSFEYDPGNPLA